MPFRIWRLYTFPRWHTVWSMGTRQKICLLVLSVSESTPITIRSLFQHDDFLSMADTVVIENHEVYSADSILQIGFP